MILLYLLFWFLFCNALQRLILKPVSNFIRLGQFVQLSKKISLKHFSVLSTELMEKKMHNQM